MCLCREHTARTLLTDPIPLWLEKTSFLSEDGLSICLTHTHTHTHLSYYHCEDLCLISVSTRKPFFLCYLGGFFLCFVFFGRGKKERKKENAAHTKLEESVNFHCSPYGESASDTLTHTHTLTRSLRQTPWNFLPALLNTSISASHLLPVFNTRGEWERSFKGGCATKQSTN